MDRLSDALPSKQPPRTASCPEHGEYESKNLFRAIWSTCPTCSARKDAEIHAQQERERKERAEQNHRAMLADARIPARFIGQTFDTFVADTNPKRHALTLARDYAENFEEHSKRGGVLIFAGKPGTGKSHLAGAILQAVLTPDVRYITCMDLIRMVRETWRKDSEKSETQVLRYLERLDLLVIDEVGMQYGTEGEQTILFDVLDRRYREVRPMVLLTNQNRDGFKSFVGDRIYDRLVETSRWVPFDWESFRGTARKSQ
jgi:DNA replication protein DnaC